MDTNSFTVRYVTSSIMVLLVLVLSMCSSLERSVSLGVASGAVAGASAGLVYADRKQGTAALLSASVGALLGGVTSFLVHGALERRDSRVRRETLFNLESHDVEKLPGPRTEGLPPEFEPFLGNSRVHEEFVEGHRVWRITGDDAKPSQPSKSDRK